MGTDGHAYTDLACPLGDAHQHDVHDANPADHERDARDCAQQNRHHARGCRGSFGDLLLIAHGEIVVAPGPDIVPLSQQRDNLLLSCFDLPRVPDLHVDVAQVRAANHAFHRARVRHDHDIILIDILRA